MPYIYKITNLINNKVYIGQTNLTPEIRFNKHKKSYLSNSCPKLYRAMRKYGKENFIVEQICETNDPNEDEKYWIKYYNSVKDGYNVAYGGDGSSTLSILDEHKVIETFNNTKSIRKTNKILGYSRDYIRNVLIRYNIYYDSDPRIKNIDEKLIITTYKELKEIKQVSNKLNISERTIRKYLRKNNVEIYNHKHNRYIYIMCDAKTKQEIKRFYDFREIQNYLNISDMNIISNIKKVAVGERNTYAGYNWKIIDKPI